MEGYQPAFVFSLAINAMLPFVQAITIVYGNKLSYNVRISGGFILNAGLILILPIITNYSLPSTGFCVCIIVMILFGIVCGVLQSAVYGLAGMLPPRYVGAVMIGNAISGTIMSLLKVIFLIALPSK